MKKRLTGLQGDAVMRGGKEEGGGVEIGGGKEEGKEASGSVRKVEVDELGVAGAVRGRVLLKVGGAHMEIGAPGAMIDSSQGRYENKLQVRPAVYERRIPPKLAIHGSPVERLAAGVAALPLEAERKQQQGNKQGEHENGKEREEEREGLQGEEGDPVADAEAEARQELDDSFDQYTEQLKDNDNGLPTETNFPTNSTLTLHKVKSWQVTVVQSDNVERVRNQQEVVALVREFFPELPIAMVRLGNASLHDKVTIMERTLLLVAVHDPLLSTALFFLPRGAVVLELFPLKLFSTQHRKGNCLRRLGYTDTDDDVSWRMKDCLKCIRDKSMTWVAGRDLLELLANATRNNISRHSES
ncbi:hypothetical protein CLOP_g16878 [Closterium sp. NIES-67]|nr:hypothetical protein CLOP_g16878 [Closterium sp. NIES-67]